MDSILEQALIHLLNEEHEKAEELMHQFVVDRARSIHESLREADEADADMSELDEELFTEADLEADDAADNLHDDLSAEADTHAAVDDLDHAEDDLGDVDMDLGDDADADADCDGDADCIEDKVEDLEAQLAELTAEFEAVMAEFETSADDQGDDMGGDDADMHADDSADDGAEMQHHDDEFEDMTESVVSDLKKVTGVIDKEGMGATGQKLGNGEKVSTLTGKKVDARPITRKSDEHKGFGMEVAPKSGKMGVGDNVRNKADDGRTKMPGYQPKVNNGAEIAKPVVGNPKSSIPGGNPKAVK